MIPIKNNSPVKTSLNKKNLLMTYRVRFYGVNSISQHFSCSSNNFQFFRYFPPSPDAFPTNKVSPVTLSHGQTVQTPISWAP